MSTETKGAGKPPFKREQIKKRIAFGGRPEAGIRKDRPSLREEIASLDQDLLRLLLKRYNLISKLRQKGYIPPEDEKYLREKWQDSVARISRDAELSSRFFSLLQEISFLPRPEDKVQGVNPSKSAFLLKPVKKKFDFSLKVPVATHSACAWAYMAAASGQELQIAPAPDNGPTRDCLNGFGQMGARIHRDNGRLEIVPGTPMGTPDRVLYAGESEFNFFLFLAHYLGRPSRVKISGEKILKYSDYSSLTRFLPSLGARMVHVIPKSVALPVRLECSGLLPPGMIAERSLPPQFLEAMLLAAPFYEKPFAIDFSDYPDRERIFARVLPVLEQCGVVFAVDGGAVGVNPGSVLVPADPDLPMDPLLAAFLLALPEASGGVARLSGHCPDWQEFKVLEECFALTGKRLNASQQGISIEADTPLDKLELPGHLISRLLPWQKVLTVCLACCAVLRGGRASLPDKLLESNESIDFVRACGLRLVGNILTTADSELKPPVWNAPDGAWALALSVCACAAKKSLALGNPGIAGEVWQPFWNWYNQATKGSIPDAAIPVSEDAGRHGRRIRTSAMAVIPELREEE